MTRPRHAAAVARHLGTDHTELTVTAKDALDVIPRLPDMYDEPFADPSQIPTYLVSALTRQHVTVALSGDGGDELFAGYNRYRLATRLWRSLRLLPRPLRAALARAITAVPAGRWSQLLSVVPERARPRQAGDKLHKLAAGAFRRRRKRALPPAGDAMGAGRGDARRRGGRKACCGMRASSGDFPNALERMQFLDLVTYLPDDILTKVDRASMAVALEARVPLLDHRVVEFAWRLPRTAKIRGGVSKWLLRQVLYRHVPRALVERPKMGFAVPLADWLRGPLRRLGGRPAGGAAAAAGRLLRCHASCAAPGPNISAAGAITPFRCGAC